MVPWLTRLVKRKQGGVSWGIKVADLVVVQERCTKLFVRNAKRNAKSLLSPGKSVRYTARNAFQSVRIAADR